jgi:hypothetical protein
MNQYYQKALQFQNDVFCTKFSDLWTLYWTSIIPSILSCLVPLGQTDHIRVTCLLAFRNQVVYPLLPRFVDVKDAKLKLLQMFATLQSLEDGNQDIRQEMKRMMAMLKKE